VKTADIISCGLITLLGLVLLFVVIPGFVPVEAGPGFGLAATTMPNVAVITITVLAALFSIYRLRARHPQDDSSREDDAKPPITRKSWLFLLRGSLFLIAMVALFEWIGFLATGPLTVAGFMIMMGERRPLPVCLTSVCATVATWLFFWQFLKFPLP
jgi:Na+/melibiose symporter-like transporter